VLGETFTGGEPIVLNEENNIISLQAVLRIRICPDQKLFTFQDQDQDREDLTSRIRIRNYLNGSGSVSEIIIKDQASWKKNAVIKSKDTIFDPKSSKLQQK